jgi:hypothetical protein
MWELEHDHVQDAARKLGLGPDNWPPPDFGRMYEADSAVNKHVRSLFVFVHCLPRTYDVPGTHMSCTRFG